jgi:hypothetical protein
VKRRSALGAGISFAIGSAITRVVRAEDKPNYERVKLLWGPNHGHEIVVPFEDFKAGAAKKYVTAGKSDHLHVFEVTADDWRKLAAGEPVRLASNKVGGHLHRVRLRAAPAVDPPDDVSVCLVEVGGNDGHELIVPQSHLDAKVDRVYDIQGVAPHTHEVKVTAAQFEKIAKGERLHLTASAGDDHTHLVAISLAKKKA